jgi:hypothetical protein
MNNHPRNGSKAVSGMALPQGVEGSGMAGPDETLGSPWPPLPSRPCLPCGRVEEEEDGWRAEAKLWKNKFREFHDQGGAKWIVIRGQLRGHNDTPFGQPTPGQLVGRPRIGRPQGVFGGLSYN